jgi:hypothetical protein
MHALWKCRQPEGQQDAHQRDYGQSNDVAAAEGAAQFDTQQRRERGLRRLRGGANVGGNRHAHPSAMSRTARERPILQKAKLNATNSAIGKSMSKMPNRPMLPISTMPSKNGLR